MRRRDAGRRRAVGRRAAGYPPESTLNGSANLLILPNLDAANILFNVLKMTGGHGVTVGPVLGGGRPAHIRNAIGHGAAGGQHDGAGGGRRGRRRQRRGGNPAVTGHRPPSRAADNRRPHEPPIRRPAHDRATKIVATLGPASSSPKCWRR